MAHAKIALVLLLALPCAAIAENDSDCSSRTDLVGSCFQVHGRLFESNGTPDFRIWKVGTRHLLGLAGGENPTAPAELIQLINFQTNLYADFRVCPLSTERPGEMQMVCMVSAENLVLEKLDTPDGQPISYRIPSESN